MSTGTATRGSRTYWTIATSEWQTYDTDGFVRVEELRNGWSGPWNQIAYADSCDTVPWSWLPSGHSWIFGNASTARWALVGTAMSIDCNPLPPPPPPPTETATVTVTPGGEIRVGNGGVLKVGA